MEVIISHLESVGKMKEYIYASLSPCILYASAYQTSRNRCGLTINIFVHVSQVLTPEIGSKLRRCTIANVFRLVLKYLAGRPR